MMNVNMPTDIKAGGSEKREKSGPFKHTYNPENLMNAIANNMHKLIRLRFNHPFLPKTVKKGKTTVPTDVSNIFRDITVRLLNAIIEKWSTLARQKNMSTLKFADLDATLRILISSNNSAKTLKEWDVIINSSVEKSQKIVTEFKENRKGTDYENKKFSTYLCEEHCVVVDPSLLMRYIKSKIPGFRRGDPYECKCLLAIFFKSILEIILSRMGDLIDVQAQEKTARARKVKYVDPDSMEAEDPGVKPLKVSMRSALVYQAITDLPALADILGDAVCVGMPVKFYNSKGKVRCRRRRGRSNLPYAEDV